MGEEGPVDTCNIPELLESKGLTQLPGIDHTGIVKKSDSDIRISVSQLVSLRFCSRGRLLALVHVGQGQAQAMRRLKNRAGTLEDPQLPELERTRCRSK